jgi:hypothetical protein
MHVTPACCRCRVAPLQRAAPGVFCSWSAFMVV